MAITTAYCFTSAKNNSRNLQFSQNKYNFTFYYKTYNFQIICKFVYDFMSRTIERILDSDIWTPLFAPYFTYVFDISN